MLSGFSKNKINEKKNGVFFSFWLGLILISCGSMMHIRNPIYFLFPFQITKNKGWMNSPSEILKFFFFVPQKNLIQ